MHRISGLVVEYIVAIDVTRVRFPADACISIRALALTAITMARSAQVGDSAITSMRPPKCRAALSCHCCVVRQGSVARQHMAMAMRVAPN